jgi:hypothetical protein
MQGDQLMAQQCGCARRDSGESAHPGLLQGRESLPCLTDMCSGLLIEATLHKVANMEFKPIY